ncbi:fimbrial protein [Scandinavium sp. H11S7]|uniref:Fimbrial protein n=1 Tax=Scandinavium hiltneri TaxID=2926519 RepID=A0ABT2E5H6_9ENTR|nr:fimbrial protein [Scandinavium hiltneri]MCS2158568.1 fimbrial protein [Scandinavium hiltneri]MCS2163133.1 fimbrial protein [Scandinavium hiltneri]
MKRLIALSMLSGAFIAAPATFAATGEGQVNFTGEILDSACEVVDSLASPLSVDLGKVSKTVFTGVGSTTSPTSFKLTLKNCPASVSTASITFSGTANPDNAEVLALTAGADIASGVGIQLLDESSQPFPLYQPSVDHPLQSSVDNELEFGARYIATSDTVTAGQADSVANFTVVYN